MAKKNNNRDDGGGIAGKIVTIVFFLILAGGIYYLVGLFKSVEINEVNLAGQWKIAGSPTLFMTINSDGTASSYEQYTVGETLNRKNYNYSLHENDNGVMVLTLKDIKSKESEDIKITKVSYAEIDIIRRGNDFTKFTKVNIF